MSNKKLGSHSNTAAWAPPDVNRKDHWEGEEARLLKHINVA